MSFLNITPGTGCGSDVNSCATGGPTWSGQTPFSRAEFNWVDFVASISARRDINALTFQLSVPGSVTYDISLIYGYNVGMEISAANPSCSQFACTLPGGCVSVPLLSSSNLIQLTICQPVPGPDGSCYSGCCASVAACSQGALPPGGGG